MDPHPEPKLDTLFGVPRIGLRSIEEEEGLGWGQRSQHTNEHNTKQSLADGRRR